MMTGIISTGMMVILLLSATIKVDAQQDETTRPVARTALAPGNQAKKEEADKTYDCWGPIEPTHVAGVSWLSVSS